MNILTSVSGKMNIEEVIQQKWIGFKPEIMQTAIFAGQELILVQKSDEEPNLYELHYLGFKVTDIEGVDNAKKQASEFTKKVLLKMTEIISD
jgi:hypothetical protein